MNKNILITLSFLFFFKISSAQLPNGSVAPDFTLTDINGVQHKLYDYLDNGYTVSLPFSCRL